MAFGGDYFKLLKDHPEIKSILALGPKVILVIDRQAYEVVE